MPTYTKVFSTPLSSFESLRWKGQALYDYYPRLKSFLERRGDPNLAAFFTQPRVVAGKGGKPVIHWMGYDLAAPVTQGARATGPASTEQILARFREIIDSLRAGDRTEKDWAEILQRCVDQVSPDKIYSDGQRDVVVAWGVVRPGEMGSGQFRRNIGAAGSLSGDQEDETTFDEEDSPVPEDIIPDPHPEDLSEDEPATPETSEEEVDSDMDITSEEPEPEVRETNAQVPPSEPPGQNKSKRIFSRWWLWALLALLLGGLYWTQCGGPAAPLLPSEPGVIVPIDSADIGLDDDSTRFVATNRINVVLNEPNRDMEAFAAAFKEAYPGKDYQVVYYDTMTFRVQLKVPAGERKTIMEALPDQLADFDFIIFPESMFDRNRRPSDPGFRSGNVSWYFDLIRAYGAWDVSFGSDQVVVAVVDDGFDLNHPEFAGRVVRPYNVLSRSPAVFSNYNLQHGTHVAGTAVAARDNQNGLAGIAPDCLLMPVQVADRAGNLSTTAIVDGILYAINQGAQVINLSLGMYFGPQIQGVPISDQRRMIDVYFKAEESFWKRILEIAEENGVVIVMAAGNEAILAGLDPMQRSPFAIKVSAVDPNANRADFSNFGEYSTISAPGVGIYSSVPGGGFEFMDGTSMASPVVAGAVGLARSVRPDITPQEIRDLLVQTGRPVSNDIGPLLQLSDFIGAVGGDAVEEQDDDCEAARKEIEELQRRIDELLAGCEDLAQPDTLKIPDNAQDLDFTLGRWKSTTPLTNTDNEQITLYFTFFRDQTGEIALVEPSGMPCSANLRLQFDQNSKTLVIDQLGTAECRDGQTGYNPYVFRCKADSNGTAICIGQNKVDSGNQPEFQLVRIN